MIFQKINNLLRIKERKKKVERNQEFSLDSKSGQVAVVLILVMAVALIFYAVTLNLGQSVEHKTTITIASNMGVSMLASSMASYGQSLFMQTLGGKKKFCESTGILSAIIGFFVIVVITVVTWGAGTPWTIATYLTVIGIALNFVSLVIQIAVVQPGITSAWNKISQSTLGMADRFLEAALRAGTQNAVTDQIEVPDVHDLDQDGIFGFSSGVPNDKIGRFARYYDLLIKDLVGGNPAVDEFLDAVEEFLYAGLDDWGIYDPIPVGTAHRCNYDPVTNPVIPSECNVCCLPLTVFNEFGLGESVDIRPECCDTGDATECGVSTTCVAQSPYGQVNAITNSNYRYVYDATYENHDNAFMSFKELLGKDDEHRFYVKNPENPNWSAQFPLSVAERNVLLNGRGSEYIELDTTGFYAPPFYSAVPGGEIENRVGVYNLFQRIDKWGWDLSTVTTNNPLNPQCAWCDGSFGQAGTAICDPARQPRMHAQLSLPRDPATLTVDTSACITNSLDKMTLPAGIIAADNECAQEAIFPVNQPSRGFWKPGADRFCSGGDTSDANSDWPYFTRCPKHQFDTSACTSTSPTTGATEPVDCPCTDPAANKTLYPEDTIDDIVYGLSELIGEAENALAVSRGFAAANFEGWYPDLALYIERASPPAQPNNVAPAPRCLECLADEGLLWKYLFQMEEIVNRLSAWRDGSSYQGTDCNTWCFPADGCPLAPGEEFLVDANTNGIKADTRDIEWCYRYNIDGYDYGAGVDGYAAVKPNGAAEGNDYRFGQCALNCDVAGCGTDPFPRSVLPGFDPNADFSFTPPAAGDQADVNSFLNCLHNCSPANCDPGTTLPLTQASDGVPYNYPGTPITAADCDPANWHWHLDTDPNFPGKLWYRNIVQHLRRANPTCDARPGRPFENIINSWKEAENQVAKMTLRRWYLNYRRSEMRVTIETFAEAAQKFREFLEGPAADLIAEAIDNVTVSGPGQQMQVVYGWQSEAPPGKVDGYWHIVKVEGRLPQRCDGRCGLGENPPVKDPVTGQVTSGGDPDWPKVKTWTNKIGTQRCFELINTDGIVKFRVTRYDEETTGGSLFFPNGVPIWKFRFFHPGRQGADSSNLAITCAPQTLSDPVSGLPPGVSNIYKGAFIMNKRLGTGPSDPVPGNNFNCWNRVHDILAKGGITSELCAQYYFHSGARNGMGFKFKKCDREW